MGSPTPSASAGQLPITQPSSQNSPSSTPSISKTQPPQTDNEYMHGWKLWLMLFGLWMGSMIIAIDQTILAVAVPKITTEFNSLPDAGWYASGYLLPMTAFPTLFGKFYKYVNNKYVYLASIIIFEAGSLIDALAPNSSVFIFGRCLSGLGAAGLMQGALQLIFLGVELEKRAAAQGFVVSVFGLAVCFGPPLGGAFTDGIGWRWCFWINLPVGGAAFFLVLFFFQPTRSRISDEGISLKLIWREMDPIGAVLILGWVTALLLALQWGGVTYAWNSGTIIGLFVCFAVVLILFCILQAKLGDRAMVPPRTLFSRTVLTSSMFLFFQHMTNYVCTYFIPFYFQAVQGVSAVRSGVQYIPIMLPQIIFVALTGAIVSKTGDYWIWTVAGAIIYTLGTGLLLRLDIHTPTVEWAAYLVVAGIGLGTGMQLPFTAIQALLPEERVPEGNAILSLASQLGPTISTLAGQTIFVNTLLKEVPRHTSAVSGEHVVAAGATNVRSLTSDPDVIVAIKESYTKATVATLIFGVATAGIAVFCAAAMARKNINAIAEQRKLAKADRNGEEKVESASQEPRETELTSSAP